MKKILVCFFIVWGSVSMIYFFTPWSIGYLFSKEDKTKDSYLPQLHFIPSIESYKNHYQDKKRTDVLEWHQWLKTEMNTPTYKNLSNSENALKNFLQSRLGSFTTIPLKAYQAFPDVESDPKVSQILQRRTQVVHPSFIHPQFFSWIWSKKNSLQCQFVNLQRICLGIKVTQNFKHNVFIYYPLSPFKIQHPITDIPKSHLLLNQRILSKLEMFQNDPVSLVEFLTSLPSLFKFLSSTSKKSEVEAREKSENLNIPSFYTHNQSQIYFQWLEKNIQANELVLNFEWFLPLFLLEWREEFIKSLYGQLQYKDVKAIGYWDEQKIMIIELYPSHQEYRRFHFFPLLPQNIYIDPKKHLWVFPFEIIVHQDHPMSWELLFYNIWFQNKITLPEKWRWDQKSKEKSLGQLHPNDRRLDYELWPLLINSFESWQNLNKSQALEKLQQSTSWMIDKKNQLKNEISTPSEEKIYWNILNHYEGLKSLAN